MLQIRRSRHRSGSSTSLPPAEPAPRRPYLRSLGAQPLQRHRSGSPTSLPPAEPAPRRPYLRSLGAQPLQTPMALVLDHRRWFLVQAAIVASGIFVYFGVRGLTDGSPLIAREHAHSIVSLERHLGLAWEATMQSWVIGSSSLSTLANWIYIWGHWPVIIATLAWLAVSQPARFLRLRNAMLISGAIGMVVFTLFPVAPPRLAGLGLVDTITEKSDAYRVLQPPAFVNQYAAMPSLHVGWDLLVGVAIAGAAGTLWLRWAGRLMPLLMALAVIVTANHFVVDVVAGVSIAMIGYGGAVLVERSAVVRAALGPRTSRAVRRALGRARRRGGEPACGHCG